MDTERCLYPDFLFSGVETLTVLSFELTGAAIIAETCLQIVECCATEYT